MKNKIKYIIMFIISISAIVFTYNNYFLYKNPILKIDKIEEEKIGVGSVKQTITGVIKNGKLKDKTYTLENITSKSGVYDEQLHISSEVFVNITNEKVSITNVKRDKYIVILLVLFIDLMLLIGKNKGFRTLITLILNIIISIFAITIYHKNIQTINILILFIPISVLFIIFSLFITNKGDKKTLSAIISSILSLFISFILSYLLLTIYGKSIPYWTIDYSELIRDYKNLFYVNVLLSGLGAIMDISITMASSLNELIEKDKNISIKSLIKSGKEISKDIIGTMTNVMLFTCFTSVIPICLLAFKNGLTISNVIGQFGQIEMIRVLTSCISIVLAVPISLYTSIFFLKKVNK